MTPEKIELLRLKIREPRNLTAHEYAADKMQEIFATVATLTPILSATVPAEDGYAQTLIRRYAQ